MRRAPCLWSPGEVTELALGRVGGGQRPNGVSPGALLSPQTREAGFRLLRRLPRVLIRPEQGPNPRPLRGGKDHSCSHLRSWPGKVRCCPRAHDPGWQDTPTSKGRPSGPVELGEAHLPRRESCLPCRVAPVGKGAPRLHGRHPGSGLTPVGAWTGRATGRSLCLQHTSAAQSSGFRFA